MLKIKLLTKNPMKKNPTLYQKTPPHINIKSANNVLSQLYIIVVIFIYFEMIILCLSFFEIFGNLIKK